MEIKEKILCLARWAEENYLTLIFLAGAWVLLILTLWSMSILIGFWSNGLYGTKFELNVGITGIGTIAAAGATIYGIARAAQQKYMTDSRFNSPANEMPAPGRREV